MDVEVGHLPAPGAAAGRAGRRAPRRNGGPRVRVRDLRVHPTGGFRPRRTGAGEPFLRGRPPRADRPYRSAPVGDRNVEALPGVQLLRTCGRRGRTRFLPSLRRRDLGRRGPATQHAASPAGSCHNLGSLQPASSTSATTGSRFSTRGSSLPTSSRRRWNAPTRCPGANCRSASSTSRPQRSAR